MADEQAQEIAQVDEPHGEETKQTDWKAEARKWEQRAKKSEQAANELEILKAAQMTEQEKAEARAVKAESELAQLKAQQAHYSDARELAKEYGVPFELLECCADRDAMVKAVTLLKSNPQTVHAASQSNNTRIVKGGGEMSNRDKFALAVESLIR